MDGDNPIRSVRRFIAILSEINRKGPLCLKQMVEATGIPYPTTSRVVQTLLRHDLIEQLPGTKTYRTAPMALSLSQGFQSAHGLAAAGQPEIASLTARIGWPVAIMTRVGNAMVARASTHHLTSLSFGACPAGSAIPVLHSASGHVFLAYATRQERTGVLEGLRLSEAPSPMLSLFLAGRPLERIRTEGHATYERNRYTGNPGRTSSISVPILRDEELQGVLTMVFFASAMSMDAALHRFRDALVSSACSIASAVAGSTGTVSAVPARKPASRVVATPRCQGNAMPPRQPSMTDQCLHGTMNDTVHERTREHALAHAR